MSQCLALPNHRNHITLKVRLAGQRTLYLSVHGDEQPAELFRRVIGSDRSAVMIGLYDGIARLMSLALQYGAPLGKVGDLLSEAKFAPFGPLSCTMSSRPHRSALGGGILRPS